MNILKLTPSVPIIRRTAAYARISTLHEDQQSSYETQIKYYTSLITSTPNWTLTNIYCDKAVSGTSTHNRKGFLQMIDDACAGNIDLILVKSISRFARNVSDAQKYSHLLKQHNVEIIFEEESLSNMDPSSEILFNILASIYQEEVKSVSERTRWSAYRRMELGSYKAGCNHALGYDEINGKYTPNKDSWIIEQIFKDISAGLTYSDTAKHLNSLGALTLRSHKPLTASVIKNIVHNEIYVGDRQLMKKPPKNYKTHKPDASIPYESRYIQDEHEAIISRELWNKAQEMLKLKYS